ncbi:MAG: hypothetical protein JST28_04705 [Acidobacteria bacterium]|nr:hypothetical protein [Acidobacteriota bacterium]
MAAFITFPKLARTQAPAPAEPINPAAPLPSAPLPIIKNQKQGPCRVINKTESSGKTLTALGAIYISSAAGFPFIEPTAQPAGIGNPAQDVQNLPPCLPPPLINFYQRFINGPEVKPLTPREKARLAARNVLDPFNAITIAGNAAIAIGSDSHSAYGPGLPGFWRYTGVSYTEDLTSEFFGTFLVPSIFHQDPHYHRMPHAPIPRRILNTITQVGWTRSDSGEGIPNYSTFIAAPIDAEIANLYVPGLETDLPSTASRVVIGYALAPTDNFVTEFLPDVARRIHVQIVFVQQIINQISTPGSPSIF